MSGDPSSGVSLRPGSFFKMPTATSKPKVEVPESKPAAQNSRFSDQSSSSQQQPHERNNNRSNNDRDNRGHQSHHNKRDREHDSHNSSHAATQSSAPASSASTSHPASAASSSPPRRTTSSDKKKHVYSREFLMKYSHLREDMPELRKFREQVEEEYANAAPNEAESAYPARKNSTGKSGSYRSNRPDRDNNAPRNNNSGNAAGNRSSWGPQGNRKPRPDKAYFARKQGLEKIYSSVTGLLNKLSAQNFDSICEKLSHYFETTDPELFTGMSKLIFEKALIEQRFSNLYAELCRRLNEKVPEITKDDGTKTTLRLEIIHMTQEVFETKSQGTITGATSAAIPTPTASADDHSSPSSFSSSPQLSSSPTVQAQLEKDEAEGKRKRHLLGNIQFIAALLRIKFLSEKIIHSCIRSMLSEISKTRHENDIESLCKLLTSVGDIIDHPKAKPWMDAYFERIDALVKEKGENALPSRLRFKFMDLVDLRKKSWEKPETELEAPKQKEQKEAPTSSSTSSTLKVPGRSTSVETAPKQLPSLTPKTSSSPSESRSSQPSQQALESKTKFLVEEYISSLDNDDALMSVKELPHSYYDKLIVQCVTLSMEKKDADKQSIGKLLSHLFQEGVISHEQASRAFKSLIPMIEDFELDIPRAPQVFLYFAKLAVSENWITPRLFENAQSEYHDHPKLVKLLQEASSTSVNSKRG